MHDDEIPIGRAINLTGKIFGSWEVLYRTFSRQNGKRTYWKCKCLKCGIEKPVAVDQLLHGANLGCVNCGTRLHVEDLTGKSFKDLTAVEQTSQRDGGSVVWKCMNEAGNIVYMAADKLKQYAANNKEISYNNYSKGELIIAHLLKDNDIKYEYQKTFINCRFPDTKGTPRFDFYIQNLYLIEYDGEQHFQGNKINEKRDLYKNQWCQENNIPLIRIPYTHLQDLCIKDLLLETTTFRVI